MAVAGKATRRPLSGERIIAMSVIPVHTSSRRRRVGAAVGLVLATTALAACTEKQARVEEPPRPVRVAQVQFAMPVDRQVFSGTVVPRTEATVAFQVGGRMVERPVDVGTRVEAGTRVARLDPIDLDLSLRSAREAVAGAEAAVRQTRADLDRYEQLRASTVFNPAVFDQRLAAARSADARLNQARSDLALAENRVRYADLTAGVAGVVTAVLQEPGQVVSAGQGIVRIAASGALEVMVDLPEQRLAEVVQADRIAWTLWADPDTKRPARLRERSPAADVQTRTFRARFALDEVPAFAQIGMTATLTLERTGGRAVAALPATAVFQQGANPALWVVDPGAGTIRLAPVEIAGWRGDAVLVQGGVVDGETVVAAGVHKLDPTRRVRLLGEDVRR
jgi:membrane fusion protein, multidrug efflux system